MEHVGTTNPDPCLGPIPKLLRKQFPNCGLGRNIEWILTLFFVGCEPDKLIDIKKNVLSPMETETVQQVGKYALIHYEGTPRREE